MSVYRKLKFVPAYFRQPVKTECGKECRAHKFYNLADVLTTLRWATKSKMDLKQAERELIKIDYINRMIGLKDNG